MRPRLASVLAIVLPALSVSCSRTIPLGSTPGSLVMVPQGPPERIAKPCDNACGTAADEILVVVRCEQTHFVERTRVDRFERIHTLWPYAGLVGSVGLLLIPTFHDDGYNPSLFTIAGAGTIGATLIYFVARPPGEFTRNVTEYDGARVPVACPHHVWPRTAEIAFADGTRIAGSPHREGVLFRVPEKKGVFGVILDGKTVGHGTIPAQ